jgi:TfoX/Sxy family transcriptional regulator of competence genes
MEFKKAPLDLVPLFERVRPPEGDGVEHRKQFGYPCCFANNNMFMGVFGEDIMVRLSDADRAEFLKQPGTSLFEPMPGRPMKEYVLVPRSILNDGPELRGLVARSLGYAKSLPLKEKKAKPARGGRPTSATTKKKA